MNTSKKTFEKIVTVSLFGGLAVTSALLIGSVQDNLQPEPVAETIHVTSTIETIAAPATGTPESVEVAESAAEEPEPPAVQIESEPVQGNRPKVALAHEEKDTSFEEQAQAQLEAGEAKAAFTSLRKHLFSADPTVSVLMEVARIGRSIGEYAIAEQALLDAGALDPQDAAVHIELARLHLKTGDKVAARMAARQAIRLDNESTMAWNLAGRVAMAQYEWQRAEIAFRRAVALDPTHPMIHNNLGLLLVKAKRPQPAVDALETSVELYGDDVPHFVLNNLGLAYEQAGALEDARDAYEQALSARPMYSRARVNLERTLTALVQLQEKEEAAALARVADEVSVPGSASEVGQPSGAAQ